MFQQLKITRKTAKWLKITRKFELCDPKNHIYLVTLLCFHERNTHDFVVLSDYSNYTEKIFLKLLTEVASLPIYTIASLHSLNK